MPSKLSASTNVAATFSVDRRFEASPCRSEAETALGRSSLPRQKIRPRLSPIGREKRRAEKSMTNTFSMILYKLFHSVTDQIISR